MSTTGQAFVKAFARSGKNASRSSSGGNVSTVESQSLARSNSQDDATQSTWLSSQEDRVTRIDRPQSPMEESPLAPPVAQQPIQPVAVTSEIDSVAMQHMHTAYEAPSFDHIAVEMDSDVRHGVPPESERDPQVVTEPIRLERKTDPARLPFVANWEINVFDVPQTVADLFFEDGLFNDLSDRMLEANQGGLRSMLVTSLLAGEGRSTVAIGMAMTAAASGLKVALVDANFEQPTLAEDFRLDLDFGWIDHVRDRVPISETAVHAIEDNVTLFPLLAGRSAHQATAQECRELLIPLQSHFDLILIDGDIIDDLGMGLLAAEIESAVIVFDPSQSSDRTVAAKADILRSKGITGVGCVENFT